MQDVLSKYVHLNSHVPNSNGSIFYNIIDIGFAPHMTEVCQILQLEILINNM